MDLQDIVYDLARRGSVRVCVHVCVHGWVFVCEEMCTCVSKCDVRGILLFILRRFVDFSLVTDS